MKWKLPTKEDLLNTAEIIDAHRIIPKLLLLGYSWMVYDVYIWAKANPELEATKWIFAAVLGVAGIVLGAYFNSGRKWNNKE